MSSTQAKEIIFNRINTEVFLGHNAIGVYIAISDHSSKLNALPYRQALGTMRHHALAAFILSLCKLYEKPNKRYPNYSIPTTLTLLRENPSDLSLENRNYVRLAQFIQLHIDPSFAIESENDITCIPSLILDYFWQQCPQTPPRHGNEMDQILEALKVLRDKRVAHHEDANLSLLPKTDLTGALELLAFAQTYINLVGYGFFGFSQDGEVDASRFDPCNCVVWPELKSMIKQLEQSAPAYPGGHTDANGFNSET